MKVFCISVVILLLCLTFGEIGVDGRRKSRRRNSRPNIIFILMDDLDMQLGSMEVMRKTRKMFETEGAEFVNAFVTSPICCPSRSSILTGLYAHNHGCLTNTVNCASMAWRRGPEKRNFGQYLRQSGYRTGYFGKYLNNYDGSWIPTGWDRWTGLIKNSKFYNYTLNNNKVLERHGNNYAKDYFTDVITNYSIDFFHASRKNEPRKPVMMVVSMAAPHGPEDPAPQHQNLFSNITAPRYPNFNVYSADKHWILQYTKPMDSQKIAFTDLLHRRRLLTLLSADDAIHRLYHSLKKRGVLDNTYIFFSSDHGYHLGQFGLAKGKSMPYETDIRIPFYALGPKVPRGIRMKDIVLNIDLAPTFLDIGSTRIPSSMDGRSVMELLDSYRKKKSGINWRQTFLVEKSKKLYATKHKYRGKKKVALIREKCRRLRYPLACKDGQQWTCVKHNGQLRLRKCRRASVHADARGRLPRSLNTIRCKCSSRNRGDFMSAGQRLRRRHNKRNSESMSRKYFSWYYKPSRARKEFKKVQNYERHLRKESSASYKKSDFEESMKLRLKKLDAKIKASRKRLAILRSLRKSISKLMFKQGPQERTWCRCVNGRTFQIQKVMTGGNKQSIWGGHSSKSKTGKRLEKKMRRKPMNKVKKKNKPCAIRGVNCFQHTNNHWKTAPLWRNGSFCFCPTSSNNSYWCLRTINATQNFLYCEFVTSFCEFFDLNTDPYQLTNKINTLSRDFHEKLHQQLEFLVSCRHSGGCNLHSGRKIPRKSIYSLEKACRNRQYSS